MRMNEFIERLQRIKSEHGDIEVLLHVENHGTSGDWEAMGDVTTLNVEDDHSTGALFVRICGDDET